MLDVRLERRLEGRDLDQPQVAQRRRFLEQSCVGRVVPLVVADHQRDAGRLRGVDHRLPLGDREAHRLFDEHVLAGLSRGNRDRSMAAGGQHQDGVEGPRDQLLPGGELLRHAVLPRARRAHFLGQITDGGYLEPIGQLAQVMEVHDLRDQAAADHTDPHPSCHPHPFHRVCWNVPPTVYE